MVRYLQHECRRVNANRWEYVKEFWLKKRKENMSLRDTFYTLLLKSIDLLIWREGKLCSFAVMYLWSLFWREFAGESLLGKKEREKESQKRFQDIKENRIVSCTICLKVVMNIKVEKDFTAGKLFMGMNFEISHKDEG